MHEYKTDNALDVPAEKASLKKTPRKRGGSSRLVCRRDIIVMRKVFTPAEQLGVYRIFVDLS